MKVLHIFNEINFSGAEIMYANASSTFQKEGFELFAFSTGENIGNYINQFEKNMISVFHRPTPKYFELFLWIIYMKQTLEFIKSNQIKVIHIHRSDVIFVFSLCAFLSRIKSVWTVHNVFKNRKFTWTKAYIERKVITKFFGMIVQTIGESVYENERYYYKNPSIRINNWFDSNRFYPAVSETEKDDLRCSLNIKSDVLVIISMGSCSPTKNHEDVIKALSIVLETKDCLYLHLGKGHTEEQEINLINNIGIAQNIRYLGNVENVRDYLIAADIFIMPSKFEGLSIASLEAMACGKPGILYDSPGLRDLIKNDDNGFLIEHSYKKIAEKILILSESSELIRIKGYNAIKYVNTHFSMDKSVSKVIELYKS